MSLTIGVDVDLTVVDTGRVWCNWLEYKGATLDFKAYAKAMDFGRAPYNISKLAIVPDCVDPLDFWRDPKLYDSLSPLEGSVETLKALHDKGHKIVFVSAIKGDHHKSKYYFLKKHFPFLSGVVFTKEKHFVNLDVMIDDRCDVLNKFDGEKTCKIRFDTVYEQSEKCEAHFVVKSWKDERLLSL